MTLLFRMLPEHQRSRQASEAATEFQTTYMSVKSLSLTAVVFTRAQSTNFRASLLFFWLKLQPLQEPLTAFPRGLVARVPGWFVGVGGLHSRRFIPFQDRHTHEDPIQIERSRGEAKRTLQRSHCRMTRSGMRLTSRAQRSDYIERSEKMSVSEVIIAGRSSARKRLGPRQNRRFSRNLIIITFCILPLVHYLLDIARRHRSDLSLEIHINKSHEESSMQAFMRKVRQNNMD